MAQPGRDEKGWFVSGNDFSRGLKNTGNEPMYATVEELAEQVADYFNNVAYRTKNKIKPTVCGLTFHLGFKSRQSLYTYKKKSPEFGHVIERAVLKIEEAHELNLFEFASTGSKFWLMNHGWKEEVTQNQNQTITAVTPQVIQGDAPPLANKESEVAP